MISSVRRLLPAFMVATVITGVLSACGTTTVDPESAENVIRHRINVPGSTVSVTSVTCPSGVEPTPGTSFDCKLTVTDKPTEKQRSGTITVHILNGNRSQIGPQDLHLK